MDREELTPLQLLALKVIMDGSGSTIDPWLDIDQIIDKMYRQYNYAITKQSFQFMLRRLTNKLLCEKRDPKTRRGKKRRIIAGTSRGRDTYEHAKANGDMDVIVDHFANLPKAVKVNGKVRPRLQERSEFQCDRMRQCPWVAEVRSRESKMEASKSRKSLRVEIEREVLAMRNTDAASLDAQIEMIQAGM